MLGQILFASLLITGALSVISLLAPYILSTPSPLVVVMSRSMEPAFRPGDLLVVKGLQSCAPDVGDVVVYRSRKHGRRIVHRVIEVEQSSGEVLLLTKGDAVKIPDGEPVEMEDLLGSVLWRVRWLGLPLYFLWHARL